jgi:hypothetical protein
VRIRNAQSLLKLFDGAGLTVLLSNERRINRAQIGAARPPARSAAPFWFRSRRLAATSEGVRFGTLTRAGYAHAREVLLVQNAVVAQSQCPCGISRTKQTMAT